jgi:hypothetical protein
MACYVRGSINAAAKLEPVSDWPPSQTKMAPVM